MEKVRKNAREEWEREGVKKGRPRLGEKGQAGARSVLGFGLIWSPVT